MGCLNASAGWPLTVAVPALTKPVSSLEKAVDRVDGLHSWAKLARLDPDASLMYLPDTSENSEAGRPALVKKLSLSFM